MHVTKQKLLNAINMYIDRDSMQAISGMKDIDQFLFGFKLGIIREKANALIDGVLNNESLKTMDLINEEGLVDIDAVYNAAKFAMSKTNDHKLRAFGFVINDADIDKLYSYARS
jgi:uncharacterized protein YfkK (UPF0435 family)